MSVFRVTLTRGNQGSLDTYASTGNSFFIQNGEPASIQRGIYLEGPNHIKRLVLDGDEFNDTNYYKRYCTPAMSEDTAILELITDDGSVYNDFFPEDNVAAVSYAITVDNNTSYDANLIDILSDQGGYAVFIRMTTDHTVTVRLNGTATFSLTSSQEFNIGEMSIATLEFDNTSGSNANIDILLSVRIQSAT